MKSMYRALIFWCLGGVIFWAIEATVNLLKGTLYPFNWHLFTIGGMYLVLGAIGAFIFWRIYSALPKFVRNKVDSDCFFIAAFTFSSMFLYSFIWVNDKNPDPFFYLKSFFIDILILFLCIIFSVAIYFGFSWLKKTKSLITSYLAYSISLDFFIVFAPYFNWQIYRESVYTLEKFISFRTFIFNIGIFAGCILIYFISFNYFRYINKNLAIKRYMKTSLFIIATLIAISYIPLSFNHSFAKKQLLSNTSYNPEQNPNVLIFLMDTLRADHLGCYGYFRDTAPNIDKLTTKAVLFENCITPTPITQLIIPSLLTSRYINFTARKDYEYVNSLVRLQEILKANGYQTGCFIGFNFASQLVGPDKGFDYFFTQYGLFYEFFIPKVYITFLNAFSKDKDAWEFSFDIMENKLFGWLEKNKENKIFAYVHATDIHAPYKTPKHMREFYQRPENEYRPLVEEWRLKQNNFSPEKINQIIDLYDDSIRAMDYNLKKLTDKLKELNIFDQTMLILISDHGEAFLEHGISNHGRSLFEEEIRVPLIISYPWFINKGKRISNLASTLDVMPTILDILNIEAEAKLDGESLLPLILKTGQKKEEQRKYVFSEKEDNFTGIRTRRWKLIICEESKKDFFGGRFFAHKEIKELYDLENDPSELYNIYAEKSNDNDIVELEDILTNHIDFMKNLGK